ncbi:MAG: 2,3,4,5-tetrahydropyridine-2,6-dicarboxylate N-succinyltransferase [Acidobacteria bacterium]|nr:2,3,4,5-tetrahydropyridine-2,6-dicarboxylate N-succinyltransferase [Acidobacteriota bacterium]
MPLAERIEKLFFEKPASYGAEYFEAFNELKEGLNLGAMRAAEPAEGAGASGWRVNTWVKMGILIGFRIGVVENMSADHGRLPFFDKSTYPLKKMSVDSGVRVVPGGSSIRDGAYIARGVTCMPPMYVNVGAYVDEGTMIDSHALVGSCAQVGKRVHLSAASQLGGVLEPVGALPVVIEDDVLIGGNCGVYEGTVVKRRAVIGAGVILTGSTPVYDLVRGEILRREGDQPLVIPQEAVVVPGSRAITSGVGKEWNLSLYTPVIVKYRDAKTDQSIQLEELLR